MTVTISNPSPQLSAVLQFYDAITTWKFDTVEELFDDDYIHTTLPSTVKEPPKNKAQGLAHAKNVAAALGYTPLKYEIFQLNESKESIWAHAKLYGEGPGGISFANESIFIFTLKSSGDNVKITSVQDFVDTKQTADAAAAALPPPAAQQ
ncbi:hypothetical protein BGY98DRAFT_934033 [Russula aff. rugulosa BPL654]|nr:hypothetical protein BGY98DRAFT_934033 [Russula aff. rugulosa BPL654]